jgi:hypothetical protein
MGMLKKFKVQINIKKLMELFYSFIPTNFYNYFKISFILLLFIFNVYLILNHNPKIENQPIIQAGFGNKNLKSWLHNLGAIGGFLSAYITVKNEIKDIQIGKLDQLMKEEREGIRKSIDKDIEEHQRILDSIDNKREELYNLHLEQAKIFGHNDRLLTIHNSIRDKVLSFKDKSVDPTSKLSDLGIIDQLIKLDTKKFSQEINSLISNVEVSNNPSTSSTSSTSANTNEEGAIDSLATNDIKESSILDFDIFYFIDWFEDLNGIKKIAISMILGKSVIFSALTSIIFIFYGDILIKKYDLENRYPKLAFIIQLRRKFQKVYFKYNCLLILSVIITEVIFAIAILLL